MKNKGITLVALVITIIILLILAGITISQISKSGLLSKARDAKIETRKAQYKDEVTIIIMEAEIEKKSDNKEETLLEIIEKKIKEKDWYLSSEIYGTDGIVIAKSTMIASTDSSSMLKNSEESEEIVEFIIRTKDNYEIGTKIQQENSQVEYVIYGEADTFTITYKYNDGSENQTTQKVRKDKKTLLIGKPCERENYTFVGWVKETNSESIYQEGAIYPEEGIKSDITLYAKWTRDTIKITFEKNDGSGTTIQKDVASNSETTLATNIFTKDGYDLLGWSTNASATTATYTDGGKVNVGKDDIVLYAVWQKKRFTITYDANGGTGAPANQTKTFGEGLTLSSTIPSKSGYTFQYWSASTGGTYNAGGTYSADASCTMTAVWEDWDGYIVKDGIMQKNWIQEMAIGGVGVYDAEEKALKYTGKGNYGYRVTFGLGKYLYGDYVHVDMTYKTKNIEECKYTYGSPNDGWPVLYGRSATPGSEEEYATVSYWESFVKGDGRYIGIYLKETESPATLWIRDLRVYK